MTRLLAVLLGVVLWLPTLGPKLAQPSQPAISCAEAGGSPVGEVEADEAPSEVREAEDGEDGEGSLVPPQSFTQRSSLIAAGSVRVGVPEYERERMVAAHDVLARERGPPIA